MGATDALGIVSKAGKTLKGRAITYKKPKPRRPITEALTLFAICNLQMRAKGMMANIQSVEIDTAATRKDRAV